MSWKNYYQDRLITVEEALTKIKDGDRVVLGHAVGEPGYLAEAMTANYEAYHDVEVVHMHSLGKCGYCAPEMEGHFHHNSLFASGQTRNCIAEGRGDFTPCFFYKIPELMEKYIPVDVALVQCTPPNEDGYVSFGVSSDYTLHMPKTAKMVIAQVNDKMPWTGGANVVPVEDIDYFVEYSCPLPELPIAKLGETELAIGRNCASLIEDGDTLQLGIGAIPDAVLHALKDKKDLGIHSEMISDGVVELVEAGVITNKRKTIHPGKSVVTFLMGTQRLYDYANNNPDVEMLPVDYVNDPIVIAQNDNIVSINSCVQVDFNGQVCSEMIGAKQISAVGGQVDFVRGASMAKNGRSILAMPATAAKGKVSRIVPLLDEGACVTTGRYDVDYIVTEFGVAKLKGKSIRERAKALIGIAHPDFRPQLIEAWEARFHKAWS